MVTSDPDSAKRWQAIIEFYAEFAIMKPSESLTAMVRFTEWIAAQPMAAKLYPGTSHDWLTVGLYPGYQPDQPFFVAGVLRDGQFQCELYGADSKRLDTRVGPLDQASAMFTEFVGRLEAVTLPSS